MDQTLLQTRAISKGECEIFVRQKGEKEFKKIRHTKNMTVNLGVNLIRDNVFKSQTNYVQWGAVSDNASTPTASDTSLGGNEKRKSFQAGYPDTTTNYQALVEYYIDATDWATATPSAMTSVKKAGLYYASSGSYLYCAASFTSITVNSSTEMLVRWTVSFADA
ncbi:MAG: hypothetical protein AB1467_06845 [Candidatus Diapherotrites archaeon]